MNATDSLVAALVDAGLAVGDGEPRNAGGALTGRYVVVRPRTELRGDGTAADPNADRSPEIQVTAAGPSRLAADQVAEQARAVALGRLEPPDGWVWQQAAEYVTGTGTAPEATTDPTAPESPTFFRVDVYRYYLTPA
ncbi:hypothetical protein [Streptomyces sp. NBC_01477]|uniref:hypothetical protein n=1 Tax=Streptomyces sp. NBC_01477 TaxID=2976015 RepID=UPI002E35F1AA|nr:hypothetical protein [Streptomyces sp. NBC_01477]